jgi:3-methyl-2-oxobutanoate hydroxymethyltransferase
MATWTPKKIKALKGTRKFATITAYDAITASIADAAGIPLILVGDSLGPTALALESTVPVTMDIMVHHTKAVRRGCNNAVVVADMPFLSYQICEEDAIRNAGRFIQEAGADAVKLEGGVNRASLISKLVENGIPVMAHIGMLPQNVKQSGYAYKGKTEDEVAMIMADAKAVADAGAFCVVIECATSTLATMVTEALDIPVIGIGAGAATDGQIIVIADMLGFNQCKLPKFVKQYANMREEAISAIQQYKIEVEEGTFPTSEHIYE